MEGKRIVITFYSANIFLSIEVVDFIGLKVLLFRFEINSFFQEKMVLGNLQRYFPAHHSYYHHRSILQSALGLKVLSIDFWPALDFIAALSSILQRSLH